MTDSEPATKLTINEGDLWSAIRWWIDSPTLRQEITNANNATKYEETSAYYDHAARYLAKHVFESLQKAKVK